MLFLQAGYVPVLFVMPLLGRILLLPALPPAVYHLQQCIRFISAGLFHMTAAAAAASSAVVWWLAGKHMLLLCLACCSNTMHALTCSGLGLVFCHAPCEMRQAFPGP